MPRNTGTNIYTIPPDTEGIPDQTIESATYNIYLHDVEKDLNDPRPIIAGGTGANDADEALANLGAEKAAQVVTNYDTHVWIPGSFRSAASATAGPVDGHAFAGIVYLNENYLTPPTNANVIVSARDMNDTVVPGRVYVREKKANVWGPWSVTDASTLPFPPGGGFDATTILGAIQELNTEKVSKSGDTMTGALMLYADPNSSLMAATKQYVDESVPGAVIVAKSRGNRFVNPAMQISQENGFPNVGSVSGYYPVDMWNIGIVSSATFSVAQVGSVTPKGSPNRIRLIILTPDAAMAANDYCMFRHGVEYTRTSDFLFGTASAKNLIVRFGWKSPAGTYSVALGSASPAGKRRFTKNFTVSAGQANTNLEFTFLIPGDTGGAGNWGPDFNNLGMNLTFCIAAGSTNIAASTAEIWQDSIGGIANANNTNGLAATGTYELFDAALYLDVDNTGVPPVFALPNPADELLACQRYYYKSSYTYSVSWAAAGTGQIIENHPVRMVRVQSPSVTLSAVTTSGVASNLAFVGIGVDAFVLSYSISGAGVANATYTAEVKARI